MFTDAQQTLIANGLKAETNPAVVEAVSIRNDVFLAEWCNTPSNFIVWRSSVPINEVGQAMLQTDVANLTTGNTNRLQVIAQYSGGALKPTEDMRQGFANIFSVSGASGTRAALDALWRRPARNAERYLATDTGTTATPGALTWEGTLGHSDVSRIMNANP